ncbi:MAG: hypothetical protein JST12_14455 [Armatimonadetes bacterium]|nr:hypothetical protein [Armatimonadota bacterium]
MSVERATRIAYRLMELGVSHAMVEHLMCHYAYDAIEHQLDCLPYRKARRPEAMIVQAIRKNFSTPNVHYHAKTQAARPADPVLVDPGPEPRDRPAHADTEGHGDSGPSGTD